MKPIGPGNTETWIKRFWSAMNIKSYTVLEKNTATNYNPVYLWILEFNEQTKSSLYNTFCSLRTWIVAQCNEYR